MQDYELLVALARNQGSICDTHKSRRDHRKYPQRRDFTKYLIFSIKDQKNITTYILETSLIYCEKMKSKDRLSYKPKKKMIEGKKIPHEFIKIYNF